MAVERVFIPWGEFKPDQRLFGNPDGLYECWNVHPVAGDYVPAPCWSGQAGPWSDTSLGLHVHATSSTAWKAYLGSATKLYSVDGGARVDRSRLAGGAYAATDVSGWQGTSFGSSVIMTDYVDDPQILLAGAAKFVKLATSTFDPRFRFVASLKNNLVGANCSLAAPYDTLAAGANPQLVVWSQNLNARAFGSPNVNPELVGADFGQLLNDYGEITGLIGGEFVLIPQQQAWSKMEGPSGSAFSIRVIVAGTGCRYPNSIVYADGDVYFWGPSGPAVLRGGEGPATALGGGKVARTLIDNSLLRFSDGEGILEGLGPLAVCGSYDAVNRLVRWHYTTTNTLVVAPGVTENERCNRWVALNLDEGRFSVGENRLSTTSASEAGGDLGGVIFVRAAPDLGGPWLPFRDDVAVFRAVNTAMDATTELLVVPGTQPSSLKVRLGKAFIQLRDDRTTRVRRVRPVFARGINAAAPDLTMSLELTSCNRSWDIVTPVETFTTRDTHGWITSPSAKFSDFHRPVFVFEAKAGGDGLYALHEPEGVQVEYELGPVYAE